MKDYGDIFKEFWEKYESEIDNYEDFNEFLKEFLKEKAKEALKELLKEEAIKTAKRIGEVAEKEIMKKIKEAVGNAITKDAYIPYLLKELKLSRRIYNNVKDIQKRALKVINEHLKTKGTIVKLRELLYDGYKSKSGVLSVREKLPDYLKKGDKEEVLKLKTRPLKAAYLKMLNAKSEKEFKNAMRVAIEEKSRFFADRIAQTEEARVFAFSRASDILEDENISLAKYELCSCHKEKDECDYFASIDFGYGKGVYPKKEMVTTPLHPYCKCHYRKINRTIRRKRDVKKPYENAFNTLRAKEKELIFSEWGANQIKNANVHPVDVLNSFIREDVYKINIFYAYYSKVIEDTEKTYESALKAYETHLKRGARAFSKIELLEESDDVFGDFHLDEDGKNAILDYTDWGFSDLREWYRGENNEEGRKLAEKLETIFNLYRPNFKEGVVYRGIALDKEKYDHYAKKDIGDVLTDYSISSFSADREIAESFLESGDEFEKKVFMKVLDIGDGGYNIKEYSYHKSEDEIIFPRFTMFQIVDKYMRDGILHFDLAKRDDLKKRIKESVKKK